MASSPTRSTTSSGAVAPSSPAGSGGSSSARTLPETCRAEVYELPVIDGHGRGIRPREGSTSIRQRRDLDGALRQQPLRELRPEQACTVLQRSGGRRLAALSGRLDAVSDPRAEHEGDRRAEPTSTTTTGSTSINTLGLGDNVPDCQRLRLGLPARAGPRRRRNGSSCGSRIRWASTRAAWTAGSTTPDAGWKGRGVWANYGTNFNWHTEGGKGTTSKMVKFQVRPDPLAR